MNIGSLRQYIHIQAATQTTDAGGGKTAASWSDITDGAVWASVRPLSLKEQYQAGQLSTTITHEVIIRYHSALSRSHRLLFGSRALRIETIQNADERGIFQRVMCAEAQ